MARFKRKVAERTGLFATSLKLTLLCKASLRLFNNVPDIIVEPLIDVADSRRP
jgi:hypothetical protein